jgi:uncharacterized protein involved in exopolysaccharide biosynthesis
MEDDGELSLLGLLLALARHKRLVLGLPLAACLVALAAAFAMPKWYKATARILPPQQAQAGALALLGQLGVLGGNAGQALGLKNPSDTYVAMLRSRTIADRLVERFELKQLYDEALLDDARKALEDNTSIAAGRDGVIAVEVEDRDPARAARLANAYIEELRALSGELAVSEASQRRLFFEEQLRKSKGELARAEVELKKFTAASGLVNPQSQIGLSVAAAAALRAQIAAKEIQLASMRTFATENNPDMRRMVQELAGLRAELAKMEQSADTGKGDILVPFGKAPEVGLEYVRLYRDVKYHETLFEVLARQYEIARIDEAKDAVLIQVLDAAVAPQRKSRPRRLLIVLAAGLGSLLAAVAAALALEGWRRAARDPGSAGRLGELRAALLGRRGRRG